MLSNALTRLSTFASKTPAVAGVLLIGLHYTVDFAASAASHEIFSGVIESLRLRCADPVAKLTEALDAYAMDPGICIPDLLFALPTHKAELSRRRAGTRRV